MRIGWQIRVGKPLRLAVASLALTATAALAQSAPVVDPPGLTTRDFSAAVQLIDIYHYKPLDGEKVTLRIRDAARAYSQDPLAKFDQCFDERAQRSKLKTSLTRSVDAALQCLHLDRADAQRQSAVYGALFTAVSTASDYEIKLMPIGDPLKPRGVVAPPLARASGGIGLDLIDRDGGKQVVSTRYFSPAREANLVAGDLIVAIDGKPTADMPLTEAAQALQGDPDSSLSLTIKKESGGPARTITLVRKPVAALNQHAAVRRSGDVLVVDLRSMEGGEAALVENAWQDQGAGAKGLVLDLRYNEGGRLDEAIALADLLLEQGTITTVEAKDAAERQVFEAKPGAIADKVPLVVVIGPQTAAGAEILAAALAQNGRATLIGERSFGRGSIETLFILPTLPPRFQLKLSTGEALRPDGSSFDKKGLDPDCETQASGPALIETARRIVASSAKTCSAM